MTISQKISWIDEKVTTLVDKIHELEAKNREFSNSSITENETLKKELEECRKIIEEKDGEILTLKEEVKAREAEIDDVVKKIDMLLAE